MLEPGIYRSRVVSHTWTTSQAGSPGLTIKVAIRTEFGDEETIVGTIWITPKSAGMSRAQFQALGVDVDRQDLWTIGDTLSLIDREVDVVLEEHNYKGNVSIRVARFGRPAKPPTKEALTKAQAALRAAKKSNPPPAAENVPCDLSLGWIPPEEDLPGSTLAEDIAAAAAQPDEIPY